MFFDWITLLFCAIVTLRFNFFLRPLAGYNSLQDKHLAGYFGNTKMKKHLVKSGLVCFSLFQMILPYADLNPLAD